MRQISRVDFGNTHGWQVRYERKGFIRRRFFSDSVHGGKPAALHVAKRARDELEQLAPISQKGGNFMGPPGTGTIKRIRVNYRDRQGKPCSYEAYTAFLRVAPEREAQSSWSITKWGVREARRRVLEWLRVKQEQQARNYRF